MASAPSPTIIVTGGSRGIGLACVRRLLQGSHTPANVVSVARASSDELDQLLENHPGQLKILKADLTDDKSNQAAVELALSSFGSIDGIILNAGVIRFDHLDHPNSLGSFKEVFDINLFAVVSMLRYSIPHLRQSRGRVIFVSSGAANGGLVAWGSYNASKAAMNSLCRTLANEEPDITAVAIRPGQVDTQMQAELRLHGQEVMDKDNYRHFDRMFKESQLLSPDQPAEVISNLAREIPHGLTGQFLSWDSAELAPFRRTCST